MIKLYKKYHTAYWCIGIVLVTCMAIAMFMLWDAGWYYLFLIIILTILLVLVNGFIFTKLAAKKFTNEVTTLYNECQANRYLEALKSLFEKGLEEAGIIYHRIRVATPRHNVKVERQHRIDQQRFYDHLHMFNLEDGRKQLAVYQKKSNDYIKHCLGLRSPNEVLADYLAVM